MFKKFKLKFFGKTDESNKQEVQRTGINGSLNQQMLNMQLKKLYGKE